MGEPAGIGAEIAAGAWAALRADGGGPAFLLIDDAARLAGGAVPVRRVASPEEAAAVFAEALPVLHRPLPRPATPGRPDPANAPAVIAAIDEAVAEMRQEPARAESPCDRAAGQEPSGCSARPRAPGPTCMHRDARHDLTLHHRLLRPLDGRCRRAGSTRRGWHPSMGATIVPGESFSGVPAAWIS